MQKIRNIAVIAHVDHGKTTLVDGLLEQSGTFGDHEQHDERAMDSNDLEKERGITILSKNTAIRYKDFKINIIDTPGHADFGGEVERVLKMVDGVLVLVDAYEGVMPQTKFVVKKMLALGKKPIVVINKIDKPSAEPDRVVDEMFDLFADMGATDDQQDFPIIYAAARDGIAKMDMSDPDGDFACIFDAIINDVPEPEGAASNHLQAQVFTLDYDNYVGKIGISRIFNGTVNKGDNIMLAKADGEMVKGKISKLIGFHGLNRMEIDQAEAGDIVAFAGMETVDVGDTVADPVNPVALDPMHVEEPTLSVIVSVNDGPLAGTEGKHVTSNKIKERLEKEMETNIAMRMEPMGDASFKVSGRGELQIGILAENMRREGFEMTISPPKVLFKKDENGNKLEPIEEITMDLDEEHSSKVIDSMNKRKGKLINLKDTGKDKKRLIFHAPTRGLMGYTSRFLTLTKGNGVINRIFHSYGKYEGEMEGRRNGALISMETGKAVAFAIFNLQARGEMFVTHNDPVYVGMIVGLAPKAGDLQINVMKGKKLTNMRTQGTDENVVLTPVRKMSIAEQLSILNTDEALEITPKSCRLRKAILNPHERKKSEKASASAA